MRHEDKPRPRPMMDSPCLEAPRPADRHARRLGVLGHVEFRCSVSVRPDRQAGKPEADGRQVAATLMPIPSAVARPMPVAASTVSFLTVAA